LIWGLYTYAHTHTHARTHTHTHKQTHTHTHAQGAEHFSQNLSLMALDGSMVMLGMLSGSQTPSKTGEASLRFALGVFAYCCVCCLSPSRVYRQQRTHKQRVVKADPPSSLNFCSVNTSKIQMARRRICFPPTSLNFCSVIVCLLLPRHSTHPLLRAVEWR
jgi:hypothetical protein